MIDLDETLVFQAFATSSYQINQESVQYMNKVSELLTCAIVERVEQGKEGADSKDVVELSELHLDGGRAGVGSITETGYLGC